MRPLLASLALLLLVGCSSGDSSSSSGDGGGGTSAQATAQVRFRYQASWKDHLGTCGTISNYRIVFGAIPISVTAPIDPTDGSLSAYVTVDGRTYKDADVLHHYTCDTFTKEEYGRFGVDLPFVAAKKYTVTLGGSAATLAEDP